jgi:hypothetical protein
MKNISIYFPPPPTLIARKSNSRKNVWRTKSDMAADGKNDEVRTSESDGQEVWSKW